mgnify:CR=1 FL=1
MVCVVGVLRLVQPVLSMVCVRLARKVRKHIDISGFSFILLYFFRFPCVCVLVLPS